MYCASLHQQAIAVTWGAALLMLLCFVTSPAACQPAPNTTLNTNTTCDAVVSRSPWGIPNLLFGAPAGLLSPGNRSYSPVVLCCGGSLNFRWSRPHGVWQLRNGSCPANFTNDPGGGQKVLTPVTPSGSATLRFPNPGIYFITSQYQDDCRRGMLFRVRIPSGAEGQCTNGTTGTGSGGSGAASIADAAAADGNSTAAGG